MKVVAIVQARMGSTRLSGKVMMEIAGKPMLGHIIDRLKRAELIHSIVVATTDKETDAPIVKLAEDSGTASYAGSEEDVLDRYYQAAKGFVVDAVVRITADCPLIDPRVADRVIQRYLVEDCDYAANTLKRTYPDGLDADPIRIKVSILWDGNFARDSSLSLETLVSMTPGRFRQ